MNKKELTTPPSLLYMFELIMDGRGLFMDSTDWKELKYSHHVKWLEPLIELGCIVNADIHPAWPDGADRGGRPQFNYHKFTVTPVGMQWWAKERVAQHEKDHGPIDVSQLARPRVDGNVPVDGKGIGSELRFWWEPEIRAAVKGIRDGLFVMTWHSNGHPSFWRMGEQIEVQLTAAGMRYFDSVPRLELECA